MWGLSGPRGVIIDPHWNLEVPKSMKQFVKLFGNNRSTLEFRVVLLLMVSFSVYSNNRSTLEFRVCPATILYILSTL